jgi:hypothetical protein
MSKRIKYTYYSWLVSSFLVAIIINILFSRYGHLTFIQSVYEGLQVTLESIYKDFWLGSIILLYFIFSFYGDNI